MIQRSFATLIIAALYFFVALQSTLQAGDADVASLNQDKQKAGRELIDVDRALTQERMENTDTDQKILVPVSSTVARFNESDQSWTFSAKVIQIKDVSIYGKPGTIAQIEYWREGEVMYAWVVVQIEEYYFTTNSGAATVGQEILLETSGSHVSPKGVNWDACSPDDVYCRYARFVEGGFPTSADYNGLTLCPSNMLIYSGDGSSDWINGMLAWKIKVIE